ncbi:MGDG synthase family glycosyltransferase [Thermospira aquatica]|uniref:Galactosyldiacylglycerol synthase n=1 Tax=Thermospira aquatica TaxID=2828656 RepID=A0AAX3BI24_9SPIR|nr:glycosyltransferase [Thermospira aquatica]URA11026.1 hypothetical protein KDW03_04280 [Thermospira aquatica]
MKRILMPIVEAGAGHLATASAIRDGIEACFPGKYTIEIVELSQACGAMKEHEFIRRYWRFSLAHRWVADLSMTMMELFHPVSRFYLPLFMPDLLKKGIEYFASQKPDMILSTHFFATTIASIAKKKKRISCPVVGTITDPFSPFSWWCEPRADFLLAPSDEVETGLLKRGVKPSQIVRVPFPIERKFYNPLPAREELIQRYQLNPQYLTLLVVYGGEGIGKAYDFLPKIIEKKLPFNWLVVCGRNVSLQEKLKALSETSPYPIRVFGFVDNMHELIHVSDVVIGKAGPSVLFESLLLGRPLLATDYSTYMTERKNLLFALKHHVGWWAPDFVSFLSILETILTTDTLVKYQKNIETIPLVQQLREGKDSIAFWVDDLLSRS